MPGLLFISQLILLYRYNAYTEVNAPEALDKCKGEKVFVFLMH